MVVPLRRKTRWAILAAAVAVALLFLENSRRQPPPAPGYFVVSKVVDGDTVVVKGSGLLLKVRLAGIDAPELGRRGIPGQPYAQRAKNQLTSLLRSCTLRLQQVGIDDFNRPLVFLRCGEVDVNLHMVETGMAEAYRGRTEFDVQPFFSAEEQARRRRLNIWSLDGYESPRDWRRRHRKP